MARVAVLGFEVNDIGTSVPTTRCVDGVPIGTGVSFDTLNARTGQYALKVALSSGVAGRLALNLGAATPFARIYIKVAVRPSSTARIILGTIAGTNIRLNPDGTLSLYFLSVLIGTSVNSLTDTSKWYRVEFRVSDGTNVVVLKIDGINQITASPSSWTAFGSVGCSDTVADTYTAYFDDYAADNADFPGDGKVGLLLPISDNSNTNWRCGDSSTSNLFEAINNLPPAGVASASETATSNIESASNSGVASYVATMATYSSLGILASDTIKAIQAIVVDGEDIGTGTKTGTYELTQNPVVGATAFNFGDDSGAHDAYNSASSLWVVRKKHVDSPSISNIATSPLMKVVKTDTTTRVGCVCFMGIYVDYTPASSSTPGSESDAIPAKSSQIVSVNRASFY